MRDVPVEPPAYVYDLDEVGRSHAMLTAALPRPSRLYYSLKANPHPAVVRALAERGCWAEVCSPGELAAAVHAGVAPSRILYTGPGKRDAEVADAVTAGVRWFSVDSPQGIAQVEKAAAAAGADVECLLRVNDDTPVTGQSLTMTGVSSQFGADAGWVAARPAEFTGPIAGFHLYMGSNLTEEDDLVTQFATAIGTARRLADILAVPVRVLDLGGGFGAPFARAGGLPRFPGLAGRVASSLDDAFPRWRHGDPVIAFESGRYLVGTCGSLVTRVADTKQSHGRPVVVLESGINHLGGMSGLRRLPPIVPDIEAGGARTPGAIVAGPLCTTLDTWARSADVPAVRPGDIVRVPNVGAYGLTASLLAFLGHPAPSEVVVSGGRIADVSRLAVVRRPVTERT
ncbi:type III PLP-dependent enzyme [Kibdelosporangium persicum]|uniref:Pyridoxal-dependent decarboxylase n=1 Tax=Kibdelosporangium persicum TaxID=2698649 RepID=A0ABX2FDG2_9PSEU|nr:Pyridoxal-dependent decarboxylase [Kibdelosporangium persicum]